MSGPLNAEAIFLGKICFAIFYETKVVQPVDCFDEGVKAWWPIYVYNSVVNTKLPAKFSIGLNP